ncbi:MAG: penicillin-binding protein 2 [Candidatus Azotimanducaceae bacterium]|jgi:penicillin-binding protein 2
MAEPLALKDHSRESQTFLDRAVIGFVLLLLLTLLLVARMFYLQIVQHDLFTTLSDRNRIQAKSVPPIRGLIFDRHGALIADNIPSYSLTITKERVLDLEQTINQVRDIVELSDDEVARFRRRLARRQRPFESVPILFRLTPSEIARISVNSYTLPGVEVEAHLVRHYPLDELMAHAVGSVRRINEDDARRIDPVAYSGTNHIGKIGVERFYESDLLGKVGYQRVETDARGRVMKVLDSTPPVPGNNLVLHVDTGLQQAASDALGDRRGTVVAIEPSSGGILALVSKPSYDPNLFVAGIDYKTYSALRDSVDVPLFNRAIQGQYEPGSTLKPFIGLAGLATNTITPEYTLMNDPGYYQLPGSSRLYRDWNWTKAGYGGHGNVNLQKAIYRSCNIYFYDLAVKLGIDQIHDNLRLFGFGINTAIDLPEASSGLLPSRAWKEGARGEPWYPGDTVNIGIGQGDALVTPLQLATAVAVIANRGKMVTPRMLKAGGGASLASARPQLPDVDHIPDAYWDLMTESMSMVVHRGNMGFGENGTAWAYIGRDDIAYRMAGKSGTAQVVGIPQGELYEADELTERQRKHAWFVAFAPIENPTIAIAVLVENGGGGSQYGSPVARKVLDYYLRDYQPVVAKTAAATTAAAPTGGSSP